MVLVVAYLYWCATANFARLYEHDRIASFPHISLFLVLLSPSPPKGNTSTPLPPLAPCSAPVARPYHGRPATPRFPRTQMPCSDPAARLLLTDHALLWPCHGRRRPAPPLTGTLATYTAPVAHPRPAMASSALAVDASIASSSFVPPDGIEDLMEKIPPARGLIVKLPC
jgi:hypothetical protein